MLPAESFLIEGPVGALEVLVSPAESTDVVAIICHPHPLFEGTLHNKVVTTLSRAFSDQGIMTVRFNFRGVGKSEGQFDHSIGEVDDLQAVIEWVKKAHPHARFYLAGFSFGAYIAAVGATRNPCIQLISVAPAIPNQPYNRLPRISSPWLVIQGEQDEIIPPESVFKWFDEAKTFHEKMELIKVRETSHFFHGKLILLRELIDAHRVNL